MPETQLELPPELPPELPSVSPSVLPPVSHHISPVKLILVFLLIAVLIVAVALFGYLPRKSRAEAANAAAEEERSAIPTVTAALVKRSAPDSELFLPGNISAIVEASIYARAAGYVRKRYVDIGDKVKAGQLMAELETPELDQQVAQARSALSQARQQLTQAQASLVQYKAQRDLAKMTAERYDSLVKKGAVARQDADTQDSTWQSSEALVNAAAASVGAANDNVGQSQANLDRVLALQGYQNVRAPFDGVVTVRNIDAGSLISATGAGQGAAAANEMYRVAQLGTLRILIDVPQTEAPAIIIGMPADVLVNEFPGRIFTGKVTRTANALDPGSRTLPVQIEIPNTDGKLFPGMYAQIKFRNHRLMPPLLVPGDSIIAGPTGPHVAILEDVPNQTAKRIHLQPVQPGRDYGALTEIASGLAGGETVVVNPGDVVREGNLVKADKK
jgi:RND family efflux transporter MFP subunit